MIVFYYIMVMKFFTEEEPIITRFFKVRLSINQSEKKDIIDRKSQ